MTRKLLKIILKVLAARVVDRYKPVVVGITGSVGKSTAKEAIYAVLSRRFWARKNAENLNNEFGVPSAVLGVDFSAAWLDKLANLCRAFWVAFGWPAAKYPKILVLELAADRAGDIKYLTDIVKPSVGVVTAVGETPVHVEFYASPQEVAREKSRLISCLPAAGRAILNYDDQTVLDMKNTTKTRVTTFGFSNRADIWASGVSFFVSDDGESVGGLSFKIHHGESFVPMRVSDLIAPNQIYGILAAAAAAVHFGLNLIDVAEAGDDIELPRRRMQPVRGIKNTFIIDDTYNSSPLSAHAALDTLGELGKALAGLGGLGGKVRKIAVLGDMRELGKYQIEAHRAIGDLAGERADVLITVGAAAKFIADSAANQMPAERIMSFSTADEAKEKVKALIQAGDIVLVKGSRAMEMEKIVDEINYEEIN